MPVVFQGAMQNRVKCDAAKQQRNEQPLQAILQEHFGRPFRQRHSRKKAGDQEKAFHAKGVDEVVDRSKSVASAFTQPCCVQNNPEAEQNGTRKINIS